VREKPPRSYWSQVGWLGARDAIWRLGRVEGGSGGSYFFFFPFFPVSRETRRLSTTPRRHAAGLQRRAPGQGLLCKTTARGCGVGGESGTRLDSVDEGRDTDDAGRRPRKGREKMLLSIICSAADTAAAAVARFDKLSSVECPPPVWCVECCWPCSSLPFLCLNRDGPPKRHHRHAAAAFDLHTWRGVTSKALQRGRPSAGGGVLRPRLPRVPTNPSTSQPGRPGGYRAVA
jgi:hypothetical protein